MYNSFYDKRHVIIPLSAADALFIEMTERMNFHPNGNSDVFICIFIPNKLFRKKTLEKMYLSVLTYLLPPFLIEKKSPHIPKLNVWSNFSLPEVKWNEDTQIIMPA